MKKRVFGSPSFHNEISSFISFVESSTCPVFSCWFLVCFVYIMRIMVDYLLRNLVYVLVSRIVVDDDRYDRSTWLYNLLPFFSSMSSRNLFLFSFVFYVSN